MERAQARRREAICHVLARGGDVEEALGVPVAAQTETWLRQKWMTQQSAQQREAAARPVPRRPWLVFGISFCVALLIGLTIHHGWFSTLTEEMPTLAAAPNAPYPEIVLAEPSPPSVADLAPAVPQPAEAAKARDVAPVPARRSKAEIVAKAEAEPVHSEIALAKQSESRPAPAPAADMILSQQYEPHAAASAPAYTAETEPASPPPAVASAMLASPASRAAPASPLADIAADTVHADANAQVAHLYPIYPIGAEKQWKQLLASFAETGSSKYAGMRTPPRLWRLQVNAPDAEDVRALAAFLRGAMPHGAELIVQANPGIPPGFARLALSNQ
jgi:hypothetical protein